MCRTRAAGSPTRSRHRPDLAERAPAAASLDDARLDELAQSIKANGVIQPIVVRKVDGGYRIIAGERRWRAAQRAGLLRVPVVVKEWRAGSDAQLLEMALIENIQREDLNPIDEAPAYERLADEFKHDAGRNRRGRREGSIVGREPSCGC